VQHLNKHILQVNLMKIVVNTRLLQKDKLEGIGWFTFETLKRIVVNHPEDEFWFIFDRNFDKSFIFADNVHPLIVPPPTRHPILWRIWFEYQIPRVLNYLKPDLFLSPDGYLSTRTNYKQLAVIHDINFAHNPKDIPRTIRNYYNKWFPRFAEKATHIATVSEYSKQDICSTYGINADKIDVVYNGVNELYTPISEGEKRIIKAKYTSGEEYFVFVGALHPRKNVPRLLEAFDNFKQITNSSMKLVIVGEAMFLTSDIKKVFSSMRHSKDVVFTGRLNIKDLHYVMGSATALAFVPYFEGFGIPLIEAMNCDVPIIAANTTSLPEVAADAAIYVDPYKVDEITAAMSKMVEDKTLRNKLVEAGRIQRQKFSWEMTADKLWKAIEKTVG